LGAASQSLGGGFSVVGGGFSVVGGGFSVVGANSSFSRSGFAVARLLPPSGTISQRGFAVAVGFSVVVGFSVEGERASSLGDFIGHVGGWWKAVGGAGGGTGGIAASPGSGAGFVRLVRQRESLRTIGWGTRGGATVGS
jgi:hypothetical protein